MTAEPEATPAPENLLGRRIVAGLIDFVLLTVLLIIMSSLFGESSSDGGSFSVSLTGFPAIIYILLAIGYFLVLEMQTGQTLGKMVMGLRVVSLEGPLSWGKVAIRTLLRAVDGLPWLLPYLVGIICIAVSKNHQRIGDMAAGTAVVRA
ncbi:MAG TPA: RDD family protein [Dehalococcoidia bacterium]|nr:RDD family protein [Dehalococcoidia bacterium]